MLRVVRKTVFRVLAGAAIVMGLVGTASGQALAGPAGDLGGRDQVRAMQFAPMAGPYTIRPVNSGKCLDVTGGTGATGDGVRIQQWTCGNATAYHQHWYINPSGRGDGSVIIQARHSSKCLDVRGVSTADGADLQQWRCLGSGQSNQVWAVVSRDGGATWTLHPQHSGKCADVRGGPGATGNGVRLQQWSCFTSLPTNQRFRILSL